LPKKTFKTVLRRQLFDILEIENDYIETPTKIKKVGLTAKVSKLSLTLLPLPAFFTCCIYLLLFSRFVITITILDSFQLMYDWPPGLEDAT